MNRLHAACGFVHDTPVEKLACETVHILHHETGGAAAIVIVKRGDPPASSFFGNMSDMAIAVRTLLDQAESQGRPSDCERCAANFDALMAARAAIQPLKGSC